MVISKDETKRKIENLEFIYNDSNEVISCLYMGVKLPKKISNILNLLLNNQTDFVSYDLICKKIYGLVSYDYSAIRSFDVLICKYKIANMFKDNGYDLIRLKKEGLIVKNSEF